MDSTVKKAMEHVWAYQRVEAVQLAVVQHLEASGLTVSLPRGDLGCQSGRGELICRFGASLSSQPTSPYQWREHTFQLPRIFVVLVEFLENHVRDQGLFRKAGSVGRQRSLRCLLECPAPSLPRDSNAHDVASLLKQFLRELPHPLVPSHFWSLLEASVSLVPARDQSRCLLLACLLLPSLHLQCLCVVMGLLSSISKGAGDSLMDARNLAIVMAPNLLEISVDAFKLHDNTQTKIVKMLIEGVDELGKVPHEVGVAATNLEIGSRTRSLDDILHNRNNPLPDVCDGKSNKLKTSTTSISGFLSGWSNKIRRRKGVAVTSGDGHMTLPQSRKSVKRLQPNPEEDRQAKRPALEGYMEDVVQLTPLLLRRGLKDKPLPSAPPTPILHTHLHAIKIRYNKMQPPTTTTTEATPPTMRAKLDSPSSSQSPPSSPRDEKPCEQSQALSSPAPLVRTPVTNSHHNAARRELDHMTRSHDLQVEDMFRYPPVPTLTPNLLQTICSEMDFRQDKTEQNHIHRDEVSGAKSGRSHQGHNLRECHRQPKINPGAESANRSGYDGCYSASLGIKLSDLPRRKLRGRGSQHQRGAGPSSPVVLSASLGITGLGCKQEGGRASRQDVGVVTRQQRRGRKRLNLQEDDLTETPPPPLVKILDNNRSKRHLLPNYLAPATRSGHAPSTTTTISDPPTVITSTTTAASNHTQCTATASDDHAHSSTGVQRSSEVPAPSALHTLQECALPRPSHQRFKSPWRWGSVGSRLKYTPVRDKGNISKRAQPYMVDMPHPSQSQSRPPLKRFASMKENLPVCADKPHPSSSQPHPTCTPLKRSYSLQENTPAREASHSQIDIEEWVL